MSIENEENLDTRIFSFFWPFKIKNIFSNVLYRIHNTKTLYIRVEALIPIWIIDRPSSMNLAALEV